MSRSRKKRRIKIPQKIVQTTTEETTSTPAIHPNATLTPEASLEKETGFQWLSGDSTNAPEIGEETEGKESYAETPTGLIDKYLLSGRSIPFLIALGIIGYMFIQDNSSGRLDSWTGILWTVQKSGILVGLYLIVIALEFIYRKIFKK